MFDAMNANLTRTNNNIEGWHRGFNTILKRKHPSIWDCIDALQKEQSRNELVLEQLPIFNKNNNKTKQKHELTDTLNTKQPKTTKKETNKKTRLKKRKSNEQKNYLKNKRKTSKPSAINTSKIYTKNTQTKT